MRILITGSQGFIGKHLTDYFQSLGFDVVGFDLQNKDDIRDAEQVESVVREADVVIHLAGVASHNYSWKFPEETIKTNILGMTNILESCRINDVEKLIFASSVEVYGNQTEFPIKETAPLRPESPYAATKASCEMLCQSYMRTYSLPIVIIRQSNIYGVGQSASEYGAVIPKMINNILTEKPILITGGGWQTRDFVYIDDLIKFYKFNVSNNYYVGETVNYGTSVETSIWDVAQKIHKLLLKKETNFVLAPRRRCEIDRFVIDNRKTKYFGLEPRINFDKGLKRTIEWWNISDT